MVHFSTRATRAFLVASAFVVVLAAGGGCSSSASTGCVDFSLASGDTSCTVPSDCTFIGALTVCPNDPSCGDEIAVNVAAAARYAKAVSGVPTKQVECGAPSPVACVAQKCVVAIETDGG